MIAIMDYGAGNLGSVYKAFRHIGADVQVTDEARIVDSADALVLPGVGAFAHCMTGLDRVGLADATKRFIEGGRPFLGICVGLQMLFEASDEMGASPGLGVLPGRVVRFDFGNDEVGRRGEAETPNYQLSIDNLQLTINPNTQRPTPSARLKVPHIGWNELWFRDNGVLYRGLNQGDRVYFVHSYFPEPAEPSIISAECDYGGRFCCAVEKENVHATQFHPEKSGAVGLTILRNFASLAS